ncbi:uncharacterized protein LOC115741861 [Rhodamnia argentea]|uniref:Uncharacterized protein LOC115741861 n=1 Tax=Rhodamnia argentea TaxID=178133 RepID=A0A8B8PAQ5_9MYRT|nr:uncharacterized protein LOC115741861 [Rhodamnia argentea]
MDPPTRKLIMLLAFSLAIIYSASSASAQSKLMHKVCSKTDDYRSCVAALHLDPRAARAATLFSLSEIALRAAAKDAARSRKHVDRMLADPNTQSSWKPVLETCKGHLDTVAGQFLVASHELTTDTMSANYDVWMASHEIEACLEFMRSREQDIPPLITTCAHAKTQVSIGLVITNEY